MDFLDFISPIPADLVAAEAYENTELLGSVVSRYTEGGTMPDFEGIRMAIIGVPEDRGSLKNQGCAAAPNEIRKKLYSLAIGNSIPKIVDLGNVLNGNELKDTYAAVSVVCSELLKQNIIPIILGGSQDITYAQYLSYSSLDKTVNMVSVDAYFDLGSSTEKNITSENYIGKIILHQPNFLFNFSNIGFQTHFVGQAAIQMMDRLYFDAFRLGEVRKNMDEVEPIVRDADILSFDITAIRASDASGNKGATPNGLFGEEACQICRYAGMSDKLSSVGFYESNPSLDHNGNTAHLVAQMVWYFIDGYNNRKHDDPQRDQSSYKKFRVSIKENQHELVFYKSKLSDRWWMEVPVSEVQARHERHHMVPCSYADYETACRDEMPERWWLATQKFIA
jgi:arginase family enzyme